MVRVIKRVRIKVKGTEIIKIKVRIRVKVSQIKEVVNQTKMVVKEIISQEVKSIVPSLTVRLTKCAPVITVTELQLGSVWPLSPALGSTNVRLAHEGQTSLERK